VIELEEFRSDFAPWYREMANQLGHEMLAVQVA